MLHDRFLMLVRHKDIESNEPFMTEGDFQAIPELVKNPLGTRLIEAFFADAEQVVPRGIDALRMGFRVGDRKRVYFRDFVKVLSRFRPINKNNPHPWNSREAKLRCRASY